MSNNANLSQAVAGRSGTMAFNSCRVCGVPLVADTMVTYCAACVLEDVLDHRGIDLAPDRVEDSGHGSSQPALTSTRFEHFEIVTDHDGKLQELGRGAMGVTYKAFDLNLNLAVALKFISPRLLLNDTIRARFVREARVAARLQHPNVATVFHLGRTGTSYFYAMEFVDGESLDRVIKRKGAIEPAVALEIADQVAAALEAARVQNIVHRDIKPSNLLIIGELPGPIRVKVIDFGLVKMLAEVVDEDVSVPGVFVGTPHYASPELCAGRETDSRSDLYSLGVTLWHALTGSALFEGSAGEVMTKHLRDRPDFARLRQVPRKVADLVAALLQKKPEDRPQTPTDLRRLIQDIRSSGSWGGTTKTHVIQRLPSFRFKRRMLVAGGAFAGVGAVLFWFHPWSTWKLEDNGPPSVAVLPFDYVGYMPENDYLGDGLTTEVIYRLSGLGDLRVISRNSVLSYRPASGAPQKSLPEIGRELGVNSLLESSIQRQGDRVRVHTILYEAKSGKRVWGASYDRQMKDLFSIESELAESIAASLRVTLSANDKENLEQKPTQSATAYEDYMQGIAHYHKRRREDNEEAIRSFKSAIEKDAAFGLAYAWLGQAFIDKAVRYQDSFENVDEAVKHCDQAIQLQPSESLPYAVKSRAYTLLGKNKEAKGAAERAKALNPNDAYATYRLGVHHGMTSREAFETLVQAYKLDPKDPRAPYRLSWIAALAGDVDKSREWLALTAKQEEDIDRKKILESEDLTLRHDYKNALRAVDGLDPELVSYGNSVSDIRVACWGGLEDWASLLRFTKSALEKKQDNYNTINYSFALYKAGQTEEAADLANRLIKKIETEAKANEGSSNEADELYLAVAYAISNQPEKAREYASLILPDVVGNVPLLWDNPQIKLLLKDDELMRIKTTHESQALELREIIKKVSVK